MKLTNEVLIKVEELFPDDGFPESSAVCPCDCNECSDYTEYFRGKRWHDLQPSENSIENHALNFLSDEAFAYFFPAYFVAGLKGTDKFFFTRGRTMELVYGNFGTEEIVGILFRGKKRVH